jgi:hypothetical protein
MSRTPFPEFLSEGLPSSRSKGYTSIPNPFLASAWVCDRSGALLPVDSVGVNASRKQTASAVFSEGQIGQSFYGWFMVGQFSLSWSFLFEPVSTGFSASGKPVERG